jgi:putative ABC transport system permease protein
VEYLANRLHSASVVPVVAEQMSVSGPLGVLQVPIVAVGQDYASVFQVSVASGRTLSPTDFATGHRTCLAGADTLKQLFGEENPLGKNVRLGTEFYTIVGILTPPDRRPVPGTALGHELASGFVRPFTTGKTHGIDPYRLLDEIWVGVHEGDPVKEGATIRELLRQRHAIDDFDVQMPRALLNQRLGLQRKFDALVTAIAGLSLLIAGIGIFNVMATAVIERTSEIGLRRAVGATRHSIIRHFLTESLLLTGTGGILGLVMGAAVASLLNALGTWSSVMTFGHVLIALTISMLVGLAAGVYPAISAAYLRPVDALRHE